MNPEPNSGWTIKIEQHGMTFYVTKIPFQDVAEAAAYGIEKKLKAKTKIFYAKPE